MAERARQIAERLDRAIATACNDDYSKPRTRERERHLKRIAAMMDAACYLRGDEDDDEVAEAEENREYCRAS